MLVTSTAAQTESELRGVEAAAGKLGQQVRIFNVSSVRTPAGTAGCIVAA